MNEDIISLRNDLDKIKDDLLDLMDTVTDAQLLSRLNALSGLDADLLGGLQASNFLLNSNYIIASNYQDHSGYVHFKNNIMIQWGAVIVTCTTANTPASASVTFPLQFNTQPGISIAAVTSSPGVWTKGVGTGSTSSTGFTMYATLNGAGTIQVYWIAIGKGA